MRKNNPTDSQRRLGHNNHNQIRGHKKLVKRIQPLLIKTTNQIKKIKPTDSQRRGHNTNPNRIRDHEE